MAPTTPKVKSTASSSPKSSPNFSWSKRHRQVLLVLQRRGMKDEEIATIFNKLFEKDLRRIGLDGLTRSIVHSQLSKHYRRSCREWQAVEACGEAELTWVLQELNSLDVVSPSRNPSTSVSVVIERPRPLPKVALPVTAERNVFIRFPEDVAISANRTRTVYGQQIPIIRATDQDLIINDPITAAEAHSAIPKLLYRFYDDNSQGVKTEEGFVSGYYLASTIAPPAPPPCTDDRLFSTILNHLNRFEISSELISTTSDFFFALRLAAKSNANPRISIIRGSMMNPRKTYHAWPYHRRFMNERMFLNGAYRNPSSHEYLVWATLPHTAILFDFSFIDLERHLISNPSVAAIFRINEMRERRSKKRLQQRFKDDDIRLNLSMVEGLAQLMLYFGINALAPGAVIASLTSEIIRGFGINLQKTSPKRWEMLADAFAYALSDDGTNVANQRLVVAKQAFLSGVKNGIGELNWHLSAERQAKMMRKSARLGLGGGQPMMVEEATTSNAQRVVKSNHQAPVSSQQSAINRRRVDDYDNEDEEAETDIEEEENDKQVDGHTSNEDKIDEEAISNGILDGTATAEEMVYEDDTAGHEIDRDTITVAIPEEIGDAEEDTTMEEEDEAKTDIEGDIGSDAEDEIEVESSRRISHPREVTCRSKRIGEDIIILDDSDDEDFVMA
ncbi:hypothetical protein D6D19_04202 [Aureobasidium pullulans]|uniref:DUF7587 domain-containing protein n=1 Tax=Aureobasidium pullulans TaxID=5580 RepID=A0A4S9A899_AURPU|nr:hypothetical protein D6D19_04202 [Aureobasidium pullulans]